MRMAYEAGARHLLAYSDSQLIVKQVEGAYKAKEKKYDPISTADKGARDQLRLFPNYSNTTGGKHQSRLPLKSHQCLRRLQDSAYHYTIPSGGKNPSGCPTDNIREDWRTPVIRWKKESMFCKKYIVDVVEHMQPWPERFLLVAIKYISPNGWKQSHWPKDTEWCQGLHIKQRFTSVAHPQSNGQVEVTNRILVQGIKRRLERVGGSWAEELTSVLWAYRTTPRGSTGESSFSLVYGTEAIIPAELGMPSHRVMNFSEECNVELLKERLDLIEELREKAFIRIQRYKNTMINSCNKRVKGPELPGRGSCIAKSGHSKTSWKVRSHMGRALRLRA
ncbi:UNVERIFIED_CONTAM: hypothetical protein Slati_3911200 [Sesamum latifolium]|uniref:Uncharacterized protein n=1 Tax=Sesamum latifolium TaxID=2727402 RepID=A0AAW2TM12_9LAMI